MCPEDFEGVKRILAVRLDNMGDVVMLGPALRTLKRALPDSRITLMASRAGFHIASLLPWVDDVFVHRAAWQDIGGPADPDSGEQRMLVEALESRSFDAAFIFTSWAQSPYPPAYVAYLAGVPIRVGQSKEWGGQILTHLVEPVHDDAHQVDRNLHLLEAVGFEHAGRKLEVRIPKDADAEALHLLAEEGVDGRRPFVVLSPGTTASARRYPFAKMAKAARTIAMESGLPIVVIDGVNGEESASGMASAIGGTAVSIAGRGTMPAHTAVIARASLLLGHDSGPMHLADAVGTPMVILFAGTELRSQFAPRSATARLLGKMTPCTPCRRFDCPSQQECLAIEPDRVAGAALTLLQRAPRLRAAAREREPLMEVANA